MPASSSLLDEHEVWGGEAGRVRGARARPHLNETKLAIIAALAELDRPATSAEVYGVLDGARSLSAIEYHLATLVKTKDVELVLGPELRFQLTLGGGLLKLLTGQSR